jgi:hypothetical protein
MGVRSLVFAITYPEYLLEIIGALQIRPGYRSCIATMTRMARIGEAWIFGFYF